MPSCCRLIELALKAPTGGNAQGWEFIVVKDREVKERLARLNRQAFGIYGGIGRIAMRNRPAIQRILDAVQWQADHFAEIPVVVVACLRGVRLPFPPVAATSYYGSIYPSVQNLLLAAQAAGLGAGLITLPLWSTRLARRALDPSRSSRKETSWRGSLPRVGTGRTSGAASRLRLDTRPVAASVDSVAT
jgi:hypothetical protein